MNKFAQCYLNTKKQFVEELLAEIESEGYLTAGDVRGSLLSTLDAMRLAELQELALQYQVDANADHFTENQF